MQLGDQMEFLLVQSFTYARFWNNAKFCMLHAKKGTKLPSCDRTVHISTVKVSHRLKDHPIGKKQALSVRAPYAEGTNRSANRHE
jgi:hypothetical protein